MTKKHLHMLHSSVVALAVAMTAGNAQAATSVSKPGMAPLDANAARTATANFLSPLKAAARAASRDLWGYMYYANAWPTCVQKRNATCFLTEVLLSTTVSIILSTTRRTAIRSESLTIASTQRAIGILNSLPRK